MLRAIFYCLELVSQLKSDAPGLGVEVRDIECSIMKRALLAKEVQRQVIAKVPAYAEAGIRLTRGCRLALTQK